MKRIIWALSLCLATSPALAGLDFNNSAEEIGLGMSLSFLSVEVGKAIWGNDSEMNLPVIGPWMVGMGIMSYRMIHEGEPNNGEKLLLNLAGCAVPCILTIRW